MREREKELFDELLKVIAEKKDDFPETKNNIPLTAFSAVEGRAYLQDRGLMVIGRAVNGWAKEWSPDKAASDEGRKGILEDAYRQGADTTLFTSDFWGIRNHRTTHTNRHFGASPI